MTSNAKIEIPLIMLFTYCANSEQNSNLKERHLCAQLNRLLDISETSATQSNRLAITLTKFRTLQLILVSGQ